MATSQRQGEVVEFVTPGIEDDLDNTANHLDPERRRWMWDINLEVPLKEALAVCNWEKRNVIGMRS